MHDFGHIDPIAAARQPSPRESAPMRLGAFKPQNALCGIDKVLNMGYSMNDIRQSHVYGTAMTRTDAVILQEAA